MRLALVLVAALALGTSNQARAEQPPLCPVGTVQFDPLTAALGYWHLQFELTLGDHHSVYAGPHARFGSALLGDDEDFYSMGMEAAYRYFFSGTAPTGAWVQARGVAGYLFTRGLPTEEQTFGGYIGALGGYTWILGNRWVLAAGAGLQYIHMNVAGMGPEGIFPAAHTAVGVAF